MITLPRFLAQMLGEHVGRYPSPDGYVFTSAHGNHCVTTTSTCAISAVRSRKPTSPMACDSTIFGTIRVSASRGLVAFGADHGRPACLGNQIEGTVVITGNTAGVEFDGNSVVGPVTITANSGKVTPPGTGAVQAISNTITGGAVNVQH